MQGNAPDEAANGQSACEKRILLRIKSHKIRVVANSHKREQQVTAELRDSAELVRLRPSSDVGASDGDSDGRLRRRLLSQPRHLRTGRTRNIVTTPSFPVVHCYRTDVS